MHIMPACICLRELGCHCELVTVVRISNKASFTGQLFAFKHKFLICGLKIRERLERSSGISGLVDHGVLFKALVQ